MVERRRQIFTHIILWILIPIILFPIVWVVSTSIRRDEAAFSTKLFSSRVSLQNYKDLIAPEKNMPVLAQEIQNLILMTPPYDTWSKKEVEKEIEKDIQVLKNYVEETQDRYKTAYASFNELNNYMISKTEELKSKAISLLEELKKYLENNLPKEEVNIRGLKIALYRLIKGRKYDSNFLVTFKEDLEKTLHIKISSQKDYEKVVSLLEKEYNIKLGKLESQLKRIEENLSLNRNKYYEAIKNYNKVQEEVIKINRILTEDVGNKIAEIKKELNIKISENSTGYKFASYQNKSEFHKKIYSLIDSLSKYSDFYFLVNDLKEIVDKLSSCKALNKNNLTSIKNTINKIVNRAQPLIIKLEKAVAQLKEENEKIAYLNQENEFLEMQKELLQDETEKEEKELKPTTKYGLLKIFISQLEEEINRINNIKDFEKLIKELSSLEGEFRDFTTSYIIDYGRDNLSSKIESIADKFKWFNDYNTFYDKFKIFSTNISGILRKTEKLISNIEYNWRETFEKSLKGEKVYISELDDLYNLIKTDYVNLVSANMNIVSKKTGDLIDSIPYKETKKFLGLIDKEVFRIDQIWKQKTKHYFLRWVRNSILVAGIAAIITTLICSLAAYPFSRMRFWGRKYGILSLLLIQMFPSAVYMIAIYSLLNLLGKFIPFLGLDTLSGLTFVYLGNIAYNMYLIKGYYDTIPDSLEESAMIDGATRFQTFYKIVFPLAKPILTVVVILTFMNIFNEFIFARIILQDAQKYTYAIGLWTFSTGPYQTEWGLFTAAALLGMLPMTILFLSLQRYIVSGLTKGAVKG